MALSFDPALRHGLMDEPVVAGDWGHTDGESQFMVGVASIPDGLSRYAGTDLAPRIRYVPHELAHAASCYYPSPYPDAAVLSLDGIGEWSTGLLGYGEGVKLKELRRLTYPDSVGFLWEKFSKFVGLGEYEAAKVMALAAFGSPDHFAAAMRSLVRDQTGALRMSLDKLRFRAEDYSGLEELFGKRRQRTDPVNARDALVAAALQLVTEEILLELCAELADTTGSENLCLAGGVALNCVANGRIARDSRFSRIFVQPMAHDAGTALGAAVYVNHNLCQSSERYQMTTPYLGRGYSEAEMTRALQDARLLFDRMADTPATVARLLADGRIGGWFQGRAEVGPRALGNRSILADPRNPGSKELINLRAKHREYFRPFAPSVLEESAREWFEIFGESPSHQFMSFAFAVREEKRNLVPAVLHVDGSSRLQTVSRPVNPRFHALISHFEKITGVPMLLNTSFNSYHEPIVLSPSDAINTFSRSGLDFLVMGDFLVTASCLGTATAPGPRDEAEAGQPMSAGSGGESAQLTREEAIVRVRDKYPAHGGTAACAACGSAHTQPFAWQDGFRVAECRGCGFLWIDPMLAHSDMADYYNARTFTRYDQDYVRRKYAPTIRVVTAELLAQSSVLDVGCGYGDFAALLRDLGYEVVGVDIHEDMIAYAVSHHGLDAQACDLGDLAPGRRFDAVTILSSLEHMADPVSELTAARAVLRPGGALIVSTPRGDGLIPRLSRKLFFPLLGTWEFLSPPGHLQYFTRASLTQMLRRCGFTAARFYHQERDARYKKRELEQAAAAGGRDRPLASRVYPQLRHLRVPARWLGAGDMMICVSRLPDR